MDFNSMRISHADPQFFVVIFLLEKFSSVALMFIPFPPHWLLCPWMRTKSIYEKRRTFSTPCSVGSPADRTEIRVFSPIYDTYKLFVQTKWLDAAADRAIAFIRDHFFSRVEFIFRNTIGDICQILPRETYQHNEE